jgi:hypothetical protein
MNQKAKKLRRLVLSRETLMRLDERRLQAAGGGGGFDPARVSWDDNCTSPFCGPTTCGCGEIG